MSIFGNFSKMFGGGLGGLITGVVVPSLVLPAFTGGGTIAQNCTQAVADAVGNWTGTAATGIVGAILTSAVVYVFPRNNPNKPSPIDKAMGDTAPQATMPPPPPPPLKRRF